MVDRLLRSWLTEPSLTNIKTDKRNLFLRMRRERIGKKMLYFLKLQDRIFSDFYYSF